MLVRYLTPKEVRKLEDELRCWSGEKAVAGWYYQYDAESAPIGPYDTKAQAEKMAKF